MNSKKLFIYHLLMNFIPATRLFKLKTFLLKWCGAKIGNNVRIVSSAKFYVSGSLAVGNNTWIGHEVLVMGGNVPIKIGNDCDIAPRVSIISGTHKVNSILDEKIAGESYSLPIEIGDGCWICANATVLGGSKIGSKSLIGPNVVVKGIVEHNHGLFLGTENIIKVLK